jgi:valyl-tRNA synthetase
MLEKTYQPQALEARIYSLWEKSDAFKFQEDPSKRPYTILMPPPNVTGNLHMGHALTFTLQDILIRHKRMQGFDTLWQAGMDHAGITTQMVVERRLEQQGIYRKNLSREDFLNHVWSWKEEFGGMILTQQKRLGFSPDWSRVRFTLDDHAQEVVLKVFCDLYKEKLIYRDKRLVNWDPKLLTAISDLEVDNIETNGTLWFIKYPVVDSNDFITVATTRPETLFGDTAVAVHPEDERYQHLIGKFAHLPLTTRKIPIIADEHCDREKGTGAVKITPAHDFNDFEVGKRHNLPAINILDIHAHLNEEVPETFQGLDRFKARKKVIETLVEQGLLLKEEPTLHTIPHAERSGVVVEPRLTDQWYIDAKTLAAPALKAVKKGETSFIPESWVHTYYHWLENIQPWCISRQLWWGHRIPAWYGPDQTIFVAVSEDDAKKQAQAHYGKDVPLIQDEDVLDTWFSSALWPFLTLGWPAETPELKRHYPSDVLITGNDIIFFWVARMMMMGLYFKKEVPFKKIFMHALVRDEKGQKMSKSKGNVIDPLELVDRYGADALRFAIAALTTPGRDVRFSESTVEGYRNFVTKLWNATRFSLQNNCTISKDFEASACKLSLNQWIVSEVYKLTCSLNDALERFRFDEAASLLYHFIWGKFCDWYIEFSKPLLISEGTPKQKEIRATTAWVLDKIFHLLHPFMPYITEELRSYVNPEQKELLIVSSWPFSEKESGKLESPDSEEEINWVIRLISTIRGGRTEMNVPPGAYLSLRVNDASAQTLNRLETYKPLIERMAHAKYSTEAPSFKEKGLLQTVVDEATFVLPLGDVLDLEKEQKRLQQSLDDVLKEIQQLQGKLSNEDFVKRAPQDIIEKNKSRLEEADFRRTKLEQALSRMK